MESPAFIYASAQFWDDDERRRQCLAVLSDLGVTVVAKEPSTRYSGAYRLRVRGADLLPGREYVCLLTREGETITGTLEPA